jgi:hypothetical protein
MNGPQRLDRPVQLGIPASSVNDCRIDHVALENAVLGTHAQRLHHVPSSPSECRGEPPTNR